MKKITYDDFGSCMVNVPLPWDDEWKAKYEAEAKTVAGGMEDSVDKVSDEEAVECYYALISYCKGRKCESCLLGGGGSGCRINGPATWESSQSV